jgi:hypothetical protein
LFLLTHDYALTEFILANSDSEKQASGRWAHGQKMNGKNETIYEDAIC